jgi:hypothetical protein
MILKPLQSSTSEPKGPVYLWARREVMEQEFDSAIMDQQIDATKWSKVEPSALSPTGKEVITV